MIEQFVTGKNRKPVTALLRVFPQSRCVGQFPRFGVPSEVVLNEEDGMKSSCAVNLHNAVTVSQQLLAGRCPAQA